MATLTQERQNEIDQEINEMRLNTGMSYPENGLLEIAKKIGATVYLDDFKDAPGNEKIRGMLNYYKENNGKPTIVLNKEDTKEGMTFSLAHEIGHHILHGKIIRDKAEGKSRAYRVDKYTYSSNTEDSKMETEANYFAASLLMPKDKLIEILRETSDLEAISKYFGVSQVALKNRIRWLETN